MWTFSSLDELANAAENCQFALQRGPAGGLWTREAGPATSNGGTIVSSNADSHWSRQCDPSRLDARWFGVHADDTHDDAPALQQAIDALPASGGALLLPSGRMRCESSLQISRSFISICGSNCGLLSKHFEPGHQIGQGSLLHFVGCDGIHIQPPAHDKERHEERPSRLGGISLREFGIAGTGRQHGQCGIRVKRGEHWGWGSTDGLLLDRIYTIDLSWCADFDQCDMSVISNCWFSECGNGLHFRHCVYNCISHCCIADNDGIGTTVEGGKGLEFAGNIFVRNCNSLTINGGQNHRILGGTIETDHCGGRRQDRTLLQLKDTQQAIVNGVTFSAKDSDISTAIEVDTTSTVNIHGCSTALHLS